MIALISNLWRAPRARAAGTRPTLAQLQRTAEGGDSEAQYALGLAYLAAHTAGDTAHKAVNWLELAARAGHAEAQHRLSLIYLNGLQGPGPAMAWLSEAQGDAARANLRLLYPDGASIAPQPERAFALAEAAAAQGHATAQAHLGMMLLRGVGCAQDFAAAESWFRQADAQDAAASHGGGALGLGIILEHGLGRAPDTPQAALCYERAAKAGNDAAATALGLLHLNGRIATDLAIAEHLLTGPAARGNAFAQNGLQRLRKHLAQANPVALQSAQ